MEIDGRVDSPGKTIDVSGPQALRSILVDSRFPRNEEKIRRRPTCVAIAIVEGIVKDVEVVQKF